MARGRVARHPDFRAAKVGGAGFLHTTLLSGKGRSRRAVTQASASRSATVTISPGAFFDDLAGPRAGKPQQNAFRRGFPEQAGDTGP